jgi:hypothetical protein
MFAKTAPAGFFEGLARMTQRFSARKTAWESSAWLVSERKLAREPAGDSDSAWKDCTQSVDSGANCDCP